MLSVVGVQTFTQSDGYSDERIANRAANAVAPQGRMLRRSNLTSDNRALVWVFAIGSGSVLLMGVVFAIGFA